MPCNSCLNISEQVGTFQMFKESPVYILQGIPYHIVILYKCPADIVCIKMPRFYIAQKFLRTFLHFFRIPLADSIAYARRDCLLYTSRCV